MNKLKNLFQRNLSIKLKITMWYMFLMTGLASFFLFVIIYIGNNIIRINVYEYLKNGVNSSFTQIVYTDEEYIEIDDKLETLKGVIEISIYNKNKEFIYGNFPPDLDYNSDFENVGKVTTLKNGNDKWYIYEDVKDFPKYGNIFIRGVIKATLMDNVVQLIIKSSLIGLPIFLILSGITGYLTLKNSLKPIDYIKNTAQEINAGNDLSKRIDLGEGANEIYTLANTFNKMFDKLQYSFENEVQFTSDVSHELRTPIAVIKSQAEYGKNSIETIEEAKDLLKVIYNESEKMSNLVSKLLILARMEKGHQKLNLEQINICELVEIACESLKEKANIKNIEISYELPQESFCLIDEGMILRVFINLISNAISYGKNGGYVHISLLDNVKDNKIVCKIIDNGIGISKENIPKIWTRFYQVDSSRTGDNSGLGLSMVKGIIDSHKGEIEVDSELNVGTTFTLILPKDFNSL